MVRVNFRGFSLLPLGNRLARFLPVRPCAFRGTFGLSRSQGAKRILSSRSPSPALRRHLSVFRSLRAAFPLKVPSTVTPRKSSSLELSCPSAFPDRKTLLFHPGVSTKASEMFRPTSRKAHPQGLATLSTSFSVSRPLEASSSSQRSWAFSLQSFSPSLRSGKPFRSPLPLLPFDPKPLGLASGLQRLSPSRKAVLLIAPQRFKSGRRHMLSWDFPTSQALPPQKSTPKASLLLGFPSRPSPLTTLQSLSNGTSGS